MQFFVHCTITYMYNTICSECVEYNIHHCILIVLNVLEEEPKWSIVIAYLYYMSYALLIAHLHPRGWRLNILYCMTLFESNRTLTLDHRFKYLRIYSCMVNSLLKAISSNLSGRESNPNRWFEIEPSPDQRQRSLYQLSHPDYKQLVFSVFGQKQTEAMEAAVQPKVKVQTGKAM